MDLDVMNKSLLPCGCISNEPKLNQRSSDDKWTALCWLCNKFSGDHRHAYQAVNEWNEARRGEKR
jgi:hypothetical protein